MGFVGHKLGPRRPGGIHLNDNAFWVIKLADFQCEKM